MSFHPEQEREAVAGGKLAWIAAVSSAIVVASIAFAWALVHATFRHPRAWSSAPEPPPLGTVERTLIEPTERGIDLRRAQTRELESPRDGGMPIDRAMDLWVERSAP